MKKAITHVEIIVAFSIFVLGISTLLYFFIPFFRPTQYASLNTLEKNFEKNFLIEANLMRFVVNQTGIISFKAYPGIDQEHSLIFNTNFQPVNFSIDNGNITMDATEPNFFLLVSSEKINEQQGFDFENPSPASVYYGFPIKEFFVNLSKFNQPYEDIKSQLAATDFNVTLTYDNNFYSIGKPIPKINVFAKEKIYKIIENKEIKYVKVRFYVW
jgi:hypothetical protein